MMNVRVKVQIAFDLHLFRRSQRSDLRQFKSHMGDSDCGGSASTFKSQRHDACQSATAKRLQGVENTLRGYAPSVGAGRNEGQDVE